MKAARSKLQWEVVCVSDCALRVRPYVGINKFSSENELVAFGSTINVNQDRLKLPVGVEVSDPLISGS